MRTSLRRVERPTYGFEISLLITVNFNIGVDVVDREIPRAADSISSPGIIGELLIPQNPAASGQRDAGPSVNVRRVFEELIVPL